MRNAFNARVLKLAQADPRIFFLIADYNYKTFQSFEDGLSGRFLNFGVAEANIVGAGAGLALSGKRPILYNIATFMTMRCFEQIRDDICFQNLNVKIVGIGGGLVYSGLGPTHQATEDLAIMRALPNMTVIAPADCLEAEVLVDAMIDFPGPMYIRLGKAGEPNFPRENYNFQIGKAVTFREGTDITFISIGTIFKNVLEAANQLVSEGVDVNLINMHTLKPIDREAVINAIDVTEAIITIEEHNIIGGLGSAVAEIIAEKGEPVLFKRLGIQDRFCHVYGSHEQLLEYAGLTAQDIKKAADGVLACKEAL